MNDLMSGGLHRLWKRDFVLALNPPRGDQSFRLIDVAGGTGDIALRYAGESGSSATATICDISPEMLDVGRRRVRDAGLENRISLVEGNAETLPFANSTFDAYTIAFGIRNVTHIDIALREAYRVLKPGGRFLCLEFSQCRIPILDTLYDFHSFEIIPRLGQLAAGDAASYQYLVESIRKFPVQESVRGHDPRRRIRPRHLPRPLRRHRRHPFGLENLGSGHSLRSKKRRSARVVVDRAQAARLALRQSRPGSGVGATLI